MTGIARIAGLIVAVLACLWAVVGAIIIVGGALSKGVLDSVYNGTDAGNVVGGFFAGIGIVVLVLALIELIGGLGALFGKDWGRVISIIYSLLFGVATILIGLSAIAGGRTTDTAVSSTSTTGGLFFLAQGIAYAFAAIVLMARWRGRATG